MELLGETTINAPARAVWDALLDGEVLKACVPGCQEISGDPDTGFQAVVVQKVGPVKATFRGVVGFSDVMPHERLRLSGEGKGGVAGFAKGGATVTLNAIDEHKTLLAYDVTASVGGKLAQLGSRVIDGFAKKMADQFFERFQTAVEHPENLVEIANTKASKGWFKK